MATCDALRTALCDGTLGLKTGDVGVFEEAGCSCQGLIPLDPG